MTVRFNVEEKSEFLNKCKNETEKRLYASVITGCLSDEEAEINKPLAEFTVDEVKEFLGRLKKSLTMVLTFVVTVQILNLYVKHLNVETESTKYIMNLDIENL